MAWTSPKTWSTGEVLTSSDMNVYVRDNINFLKDVTERGFRYLADTLRTVSTTSTNWTVVHQDFAPTINMTGGKMKVGFVGWVGGSNLSDLEVRLTIDGIQGGRYLIAKSNAGEDLVLAPTWVDFNNHTGNTPVSLEFRTTSSGNPAEISVRQFWVEEI